MSGASDFFKKLQNNIGNIEQEILTKVIAVEAENFHAKNFADEGFTDTSLQKWTPRKKAVTPKRSLLVKTSTMKGQALKGQVKGGSVDFAFSLDYMKVHNEGGQSGRGNGFTMAKRQFVGESEYLKKKIEAQATKLIDLKLNNL